MPKREMRNESDLENFKNLLYHPDQKIAFNHPEEIDPTFQKLLDQLDGKDQYFNVPDQKILDRSTLFEAFGILIKKVMTLKSPNRKWSHENHTEIARQVDLFFVVHRSVNESDLGFKIATILNETGCGTDLYGDCGEVEVDIEAKEYIVVESILLKFEALLFKLITPPLDKIDAWENLSQEHIRRKFYEHIEKFLTSSNLNPLIIDFGRAKRQLNRDKVERLWEYIRNDRALAGASNLLIRSAFYKYLSDVKSDNKKNKRHSVWNPKGKIKSLAAKSNASVSEDEHDDEEMNNEDDAMNSVEENDEDDAENSTDEEVQISSKKRKGHVVDSD